MEMPVDRQRLMRELSELAEYSDAPEPAVTRILFTEPDLQARGFFERACRSADLEFRQDACGNLFARWTGRDRELPPIATGSHCDAIPHSGRYDGTVGVWGGLEAIRALQQSGYQPRRSIELIMFTAEEPTRYGIGCLGSRLMSGVLAPQLAETLPDSSGEAFGTTRLAAGCNGSLDSVRLGTGTYEAFVELHIEQGPLLEQQQIDIGVVTAIAAPAAMRVTYQGTGGHAGAVLMKRRRDALLPAAELVLRVASAASELGGDDTVATTGVLDVFPRAINSIPSKTYLEIDIRDTVLARRDAVLDHVTAAAREIGRRHQQECTVDLISKDSPAACGEHIVKTIEDACSTVGVTHQRMISRAYHDCLFMALLCPTAMIFIPCRDGISHRPDEYSSPEQIENGVRVLAHTLAELAN